VTSRVLVSNGGLQRDIAPAFEGTGLYGDCDYYAGAWDWGDDGDFYAGSSGDVEVAAGYESG
jgi:hypothetical protein